MSETNNFATCRIRIIIRLFIVSVLFLLIIALTLTDKLEYLSFINAWNVAILILFFGSISVVTCIFYKNGPTWTPLRVSPIASDLPAPGSPHAKQKRDKTPFLCNSFASCGSLPLRIASNKACCPIDHVRGGILRGRRRSQSRARTEGDTTRPSKVTEHRPA